VLAQQLAIPVTQSTIIATSAVQEGRTLDRVRGMEGSFEKVALGHGLYPQGRK
jgi:hypothetical protein